MTNPDARESILYRVTRAALARTASRCGLLQAVEFRVEGNRTRVPTACEDIFILATLEDALGAVSLAVADVEEA